MSERNVWHHLQSCAPNLCARVDGLTAAWVAPVFKRLERAQGIPRFPKTLNDAVWGTIELLPCEVLLLDSPLLQRLRGIRQLGMAHLVYPGAGYDRLEHSLGVLEAAQQMLSALTKNADRRREYPSGPDQAIPVPSQRDISATRLGALLHDVGHAPFSHATEHLISREYSEEFAAANTCLRDEFEGVTSIEPAEQIAAAIVLSSALRAVFEHSRFNAGCEKGFLSEAIAARILGSRSYLQATYLSGVVSGPLDADKVDYLARDSHHAGLPLGLDTTRLVSKLEVVEVTAANALNPELRTRAGNNGGRFYDLGLSRAGLGAFEQMVMARVTLYERLYYHHKIRAAEGMIRSLVSALERRGSPVTLDELYSNFGDDTIIQLWGGSIRCDSVQAGDRAASSLAKRIRERDLFHRAYSFSSRFIAGLEGLPESERVHTRAILWSGVTGALEDFEGAQRVAEAIFEKAKEICSQLPRFKTQLDDVCASDIIVDLPKHSRVAKNADILISSEAGHIGTPNLYFNADKWADAYVHQKQCGYVFAPPEVLQIVALASRIVFYEKFRIVMGQGADIAAKTHGLLSQEVYDELSGMKLCSAECLAVLRDRRTSLVAIGVADLQIPQELAIGDPNLASRLADEFSQSMVTGLPGGVHEKVVQALAGMLRAMHVIEMAGDLAACERLDERSTLQPKLRDSLRAAGVSVTEGSKLGGGETDLILLDTIVLENKVLGSVKNPFERLAPASWQVRRYAMALSQQVRFVCAGYCPPDELDKLSVTQSIKVRRAVGQELAIEVLFLVPYGYGVPSRAIRRASD